MKTAICISGIGRSIEHTFDNIRKNLIDTFEDPIVLVHLGKSKTSDKAVELFSSLKNTEIKLIDESHITESGIRYLPNWLDGHNDDTLYPDGKPPTADNFTRSLFSRSFVFDMVDEWEIRSNQTADVVLYSRDDVHYLKPVYPLVKGLDMSKLWIPHFHHWDPSGGDGGYCDRFAISNKKNMGIYTSMSKYIKEYSENMYIHAETTLKHHLDKHLGMNKVKTFHIEVNRVFSDGNLMDEGFPNPAAIKWQ